MMRSPKRFPVPLVHINETNSTNNYLQALCARQQTEEFTTVVADFQTSGRGQRGNSWESAPGMNLTFSTVLYPSALKAREQFTLSMLIALSVYDTLSTYAEGFSIKWPNDILAENKKIGGILIENTFKNSSEVQSIIGIGLNVNQSQFENLPQASSLFLLENKIFDRETMLISIVNQLEFNLKQLPILGETHFWNAYHQILFKKDVVSAFESVAGNRFVGKIQEVTQEGKLAVLLEDDSVQFFDVKEVKMLY